MEKLILTAAVGGVALALAACGQEGALNEQNETVAGNDMNVMMADPKNPYAQAEMQMHDAMMAAKGADASETWIRKMIEHHRGAVAMSDVLLTQQGVSPALRAEAEKTKTEQQQGIANLERMLRGGSTTADGQPARGAGEPATADPKAAPKPVPKPAPKPEPADPHAGHVMNNSQ